MKKLFLCLFVFSITHFIFTPVSGTGIRLKGETSWTPMWATRAQVPFWFWANTLGCIPQQGGSHLYGNISLRGIVGNDTSRVKFFFGGTASGYTGKNNKLMFTELYGGIRSKLFIYQCGAIADSEIYNGLSMTNGNLLNSRNARPYPRISLHTNGFLPLFGQLSASVHWDEGYLPGHRVVKNPLFHHKNIFIRYGRSEDTYFIFGVDHYAFWGGESPISGSLPHGFDDYLRIITTSKGNSEYSSGDQLNVAGNHIGQYLLIAGHNFEGVKIEARIAHPFEDGSGMRLVNFPDNLYGLYLHFKKRNFIESALFEFLYTLNQSGTDTGEGGYSHLHGHDNYFNHGEYRSGYTYRGYTMGIPLFFPLNKEGNGTIAGIANNRIRAYHFGLSGLASESVSWKLLLTFSESYGTFSAPFTPVRKQFSGFCQGIYSLPNQKFYFKLAFGYDRGTNLNNGLKRTNTGIQFTFGTRL